MYVSVSQPYRHIETEQKGTSKFLLFSEPILMNTKFQYYLYKNSRSNYIHCQVLERLIKIFFFPPHFTLIERLFEWKMIFLATNINYKNFYTIISIIFQFIGERILTGRPGSPLSPFVPGSPCAPCKYEEI